jgi:hypothetical protein
MFEPMRKKAPGGLTKLNYVKFHYLFHSPNIVGWSNPRAWVGEYMYEKAYKILVGKDCGRDHWYDLDVVQTQY